MRDAFGRRVNYLRVSITDRCNERCVYCMPASGLDWLPGDRLLTDDELIRLLKIASALGIERYRITGGEPLVRPGAVDLIARLRAEVAGVRDLALSTNGMLLAQRAEALRAAGVDRLNVSLDSLRPDRYAAITRTGDLDRVLEGIQLARELGFDPVKINMVVMRGVNDDEVLDFAAWTLEAPVHVRFIELMPLGEAYRWSRERLVSAVEIRRRIEAAFELETADVFGAGPADYARIRGAPGTLGFISPLSAHFCAGCNRLRLSADGKLNPCLGHLLETDLRTPLRAGASDEELAHLFARTIRNKPEHHDMALYTLEGAGRQMSKIGG